MNAPPDLGTTILTSWRTNSRVTAYLIEHLPAALWDAPVPGAPRRTGPHDRGGISTTRGARG